MNITTTRIRAGLYEITTSWAGTSIVERIPQAGWFITFPGCSKPDEWADTLGHAEMIVGAFEAPEGF